MSEIYTEKSESKIVVILKYIFALAIVVSAVFLIAPLIAGFTIIVLILMAFGVGVNTVSYSVSLSNILVKQFVTGVIIVLAAIWISFAFLDIYTHHSQKIVVPSFIGLTFSEAERLANSKDLKCEVLDSNYRLDKPKGVILEQIPPINFKVKENRTIFLTINAFGTEMIVMPNLVGNSLIQAQADLEAHGLVIGLLEYIPDIAKNYVLKQRYKGRIIREGSKIPKGSRIDLVLGQGEGEPSPAPDLIGLSKSVAMQTANSNFFNIGAELYDETIKTEEDTLSALIWKQNPAKGEVTSMGSFIDIWFTIDYTKISKDTIE